MLLLLAAKKVKGGEPMFAELVSPGTEGPIAPMGGCYPRGDIPIYGNCWTGYSPQTGWCGAGAIKF
ncbi:MAG: hypothetical protein AYK19_10260 [Theionarchaea archaeon DG-70-1]|nr:MAG: hypothetical protein AYK19_10260 [Theionarchaea archaeon DG-70-1]